LYEFKKTPPCVKSVSGVLVLLLMASHVAAADPAPAVFGFEQRVRNENWNNLFDYSGATDDEREQIRYRTRVWAQLPLTSVLEFNVGLASETYQKFGQKSVMDEVIFDQLNLNIKKLFVKGLSLKIGRQDLMRGEGFVLMEGTPGDGSRTTYFNAVNLAYAFRKSKVELIGILNPRQDRMLPVWNDQHKYMLDWEDQALGVYYTDKNHANTSYELYFFHKKEIRNRLAKTNAQYQPDRRVETAGGRVTHRFDRRWSVTSEFAGQWGVQRPTTPIRAWGGYGYVRRDLEARWKPYVQGGFWALSGDDPSRKDRISGWDPIFSRWPKWGDLELYSEVPEKSVGYATNQKRWHLETGVAPTERMSLKFVYYHVSAFHPYTAGSQSMFASGTSRGDNFQTRFDFTLNSHLRGHVDYQTLAPGSFYAQRSRAYFLRFELLANATVAVRNLARVFGD
jgi:hypothetical protein